MAKIREVIPPTAPTYVLELTQEEVDVIAGIAHDLVDNRSVYMGYPVDGEDCVPSERGMEALKSLSNALIKAQSNDYDYFDYWEERKNDG